MQTLDNVTTVTSDSGQQTASATVGVNNQPLAPTNVSTGLTNYFFLDSFFLPLLIAVVGVWLYKQGFIGLPKWAQLLQAGNKENRAQKVLAQKTAEIRKQESSK